MEIVFEAKADASPEGWEGFTKGVWEEDGGKYVSCSTAYFWKLLGMRFNLVDIAIFFPEGAISDESREAEVEELGESAGFGVVGVSEARAIKAAQNGREMLEEDALEVGVFLVGADYVWGCGEWIIVPCGLGEGVLGDSRSIVIRGLWGRHCCRVERETSVESSTVVDGIAAFRAV